MFLNLRTFKNIYRLKVDLRKKFHSKFKKTLSTKQIAQLYHAEERFKAVLLKRFRESDNPTYRKRR